MTETPFATFPVPRFQGARASRDYAQRVAQQYRSAVRRILDGGARSSGDIAAELNRASEPSPAGRPWDAGSVGRLLKRLGIDRGEWLERDAEAVREPIEGFWQQGIRTAPQLAIALTRSAVPCRGGHWTAARVATLLKRLAGDWMIESNPRLQRGDSVPLATTLPTVAELIASIEAPKVSTTVEAPAPLDAEPREASPRRRAIRA